MTRRPGRTARGEEKPLYLQAARRLEAILDQTPSGAYLPSEPTLARRVGVSRATLREAMRTFEEQGRIVRRQGVGTMVTSPPLTLEAGLEVLESLETLARRSGLAVKMADLRVAPRPAGEDAAALETHDQAPVLEISRVMQAEGRPVALLVDVIPDRLLPRQVWDNGFTGSVLDVLLREGSVNLDVSRTEIGALSAPPEIARRLRIQRGDVLLRLEARLFDRNGLPVDHSWSYFLPGSLRLHVVRRVGRRAGSSLSSSPTGDSKHA